MPTIAGAAAGRCEPRPCLAVRLLTIACLALTLLAPGAVLVRASAPRPASSPTLTRYTLTNTLPTGSTGRPGYPVDFTIRITNVGESWITVLPLTDLYNPAYLSFSLCTAPGKASVTPDDMTDDGRLDWLDLTAPWPYGFGADLAPGGSFTIVVTFMGIQDTSFIVPGHMTTNTARVHDGRADPDGPDGPLPADEPLPAQSDTVAIGLYSPTCGFAQEPGTRPAAAGAGVSPNAADCSTRFQGTVWRDDNYNGVMSQDTEEVYGINGVRVNEYLDDGDAVFEPGADDALFDTAVTAPDPSIVNGLPGEYTMAAPRGDYCALPKVWIDVDPANFEPRGPLSDMVLTSGPTYGRPPRFFWFSAPNWVPNPEETNFGYNAAGHSSFGLPYEPAPVSVREPFVVPVTVTNTGDTWISALPLTVSYDPTYVTYTGASPASDDKLDDGTINWRDVLNPGTTAAAQGPQATELAPGKSITVQLHFVGASDTTDLLNGETTILFKSEGAFADPDGPEDPLDPIGPLPASQGSATVNVYIPTGVTLAQPHAEQDADGARLSWQTASEAHVLGFNVLRRSGSGYAQANPEFILAAHAGLDRGEEYTFVDPGAQTNGVHYALEVVYLDGRKEIVEVR